MTRKELLELACLDALGLLDDVESEFYTRSFHDAPATVQDDIQRLQAEIAGDLTILPREEPDPSLRERVLKAVADAIEREDFDLAPLATIGRRRGDAEPGEGRYVSGQFWRAAAFVLAGVTVVFALFYAEAKQHGNRVSEIALINNTSATLERLIGPTVKDFLFDGASRYIVLEPKPGIEAHAVVCYNERTGRAFLITDRLDQAGDDTYTIAYVPESGARTNLRKFASTGGVQGIALDALNAAAVAAVRWEIINSAGAVILSSA